MPWIRSVGQSYHTLGLSSQKLFCFRVLKCTQNLFIYLFIYYFLNFFAKRSWNAQNTKYKIQGLEMHTKPWVRARASKEYWEKMKPAGDNFFVFKSWWLLFLFLSSRAGDYYFYFCLHKMVIIIFSSKDGDYCF